MTDFSAYWQRRIVLSPSEQFLQADLAMRALGDEVSLHPSLHGVWHKPVLQATFEVARYAGVTLDPGESAVEVMQRLTKALREKRCRP